MLLSTQTGKDPLLLPLPLLAGHRTDQPTNSPEVCIFSRCPFEESEPKDHN